MSRINKHQMIRNMTGMNSGGGKTNGGALAAGPDNIPAVITDQAGNPQAPAAIKEGEIIFSVEAVIGAGKGDYDAGADFLVNLQEKLRELGLKYLENSSLAGAPPIA